MLGDVQPESHLVSSPTVPRSRGLDGFFPELVRDLGSIESRLQTRALRSQSAAEKQRLLKLAEYAASFASLCKKSGGRYV
jgi:hypothetical protein